MKMGIIERKQRLREKTRKDILDAALVIVNNEGWQALSMRKIAKIIEYTAPVIYEHFKNKEAILAELTSSGYRKLTSLMERAKAAQITAVQQIEAMWLAYWEFAFIDKESYKLMFGVTTPCCNIQVPNSNYPYETVRGAIISLGAYENAQEEVILSKYYSYWAMAHGLIAITLINKGAAESINKEILIHEIQAITNSIVL
jgi:AcrR family transcriptional regulator